MRPRWKRGSVALQRIDVSAKPARNIGNRRHVIRKRPISLGCTILIALVALPNSQAENRAKPIPIQPAKAIKGQTRKARPIAVDPAKPIAVSDAEALPPRKASTPVYTSGE